MTINSERGNLVVALGDPRLSLGLAWHTPERSAEIRKRTPRNVVRQRATIRVGNRRAFGSVWLSDKHGRNIIQTRFAVYQSGLTLAWVHTRHLSRILCYDHGTCGSVDVTEVSFLGDNVGWISMPRTHTGKSTGTTLRSQLD